MFVVRAKCEADNDELGKAWTNRYGSVAIVSRGIEYRAQELPGLVADHDGEILGALTWHLEDGALEVITLDSFVENAGVGTALLEAAISLARGRNARRVWLITSNDNIRALRFYQRRGWDMAAFYRDAITKARKLKPEIPETGDDNISVRHEIEFEFLL